MEFMHCTGVIDHLWCSGLEGHLHGYKGIELMFSKWLRFMACYRYECKTINATFVDFTIQVYILAECAHMISILDFHIPIVVVVSYPVCRPF
jgi:hypothetical protein